MQQITAAEGQRIDDRPLYVGLRRPLIPMGCDQQGRHPEAAHAASEYTDDDDKPGAGAGVFLWPAGCALAIFAALLIVHFWHA